MWLCPPERASRPLTDPPPPSRHLCPPVEAKADTNGRLQTQLEELRGNTSGKVDKYVIGAGNVPLWGLPRADSAFAIVLSRSYYS